MDNNFLYINSVDPTKITCKIKEKFSKLTLSSKKRLLDAFNNEENEKSEQNGQIDKNHTSRNLKQDLLTADESDNGVEILNKLLRSETTEDSKESARLKDESEKSVFSERLQLSDSDDTFCSMEEKNVKFDEQKQPSACLIPERQSFSTNMLDHKSIAKYNINQLSDKVSSISLESPKIINLQVLTEDVDTNVHESSQIVSTESLRKSSCYKSTPEFLIVPTDERISMNKSLIVISSTEASPCQKSAKSITLNTSTDDKSQEIIILTDSDEESDISIGQYQRHVSDNLSINKSEFRTTLTTAKADRIQRFLKDVHANQIGNAYADPENMTESLYDKLLHQPQKQSNVHIASDDTQSMHESVFEKGVESLTGMTGTKLIVPEKTTIQGTTYKQIAEQDTESMESSMVLTERDKEAEQSLHTSNSVPDESLTVAETSSENNSFENQTPQLVTGSSKNAFPIENTILNTEEFSNQIQRSESYKISETSDLDQIGDRIRNINISAKINIKIQITGQIEENSFHHFSSKGNENSGGDSDDSSLESEDNSNSCDSLHKNTTSVSIRSPKSPKTNGTNVNIPKIQPSIVSTNVSKLDITKKCPLLSTSPKQKAISDATPIKTNTPQKETRLIVETTIIETSACTPKHINTNKDMVDDDYLKTANDLLTKLYGETWKTPDVIKTLKKQSNSGKKTPENKIDESVLDDFSMFQKNIPDNLDSTRLEKTFKKPSIKPAVNDKANKPASKPRSVKKAITQKTYSKTIESNEMEDTPKVVITKKGRQVKARVQNITGSESESEEISDNSFCIETDSESSLEYVLGVKPTTRRAKRNSKRSQKDKLVFLDLTSDEIKVVKELDKCPPVNKDDHLLKLLDSCKYEKPKMISTPPANAKTKRKLFTPRFGSEDEEVPVDSPLKPYLSSSDEEKENVKMSVPLPFNLINKKLESVRTGQPVFKLSTPKSISKKTNTIQQDSSIKKLTTEVTTPTSSAKKTHRIIDKIADTPNNKYGFLKSLDVCVSKTLCHPDALFYRDNYRNKKFELADKLYEIYNARCFKNELNVPLAWNKKLLNTAGRCTNKKKGSLRFSVVELSEKVLTSADRLRCTLMHELCHAATWIFNGEHGHGATWKSWAFKANQTFPELPKIGVCHQYDIEYKYTYKCSLCGASSHAHSKSKKVEHIRCSYCHGAIEIFLNKKDKTGNMIPTPIKSPKGFAKFVKQKYREFKKPNLKHTEVMKLLSAAYAESNEQYKPINKA